MDPAIDRSSRSAVRECKTPTQSSGNLHPDEARAILSDLSGTPLPPGRSWDAEAARRLAAFQRSEGLPATGHLDDVTETVLRARFEQITDARKTEGAAPLRHESPTAEEHDQIAALARAGLHAVEELASQLAADTPIRAAYVEEARAYSASLVKAFDLGEITAGEAAFMANKMRNSAMTDARKGLSHAGNALSKLIKEEGLTLPALFEKYAAKMYGKSIRELTAAEQSAVCVKIAERAGVTNGRVNLASELAPKFGKAMTAVAIAVAIYQVATAEDKVAEGVKQGAGFLGFLAGAKVGAVGGAFVCGPPCAVIGGLATGIAVSLLAEETAQYGYERIKG